MKTVVFSLKTFRKTITIPQKEGLELPVIRLQNRLLLG
jgi:hypothetical protein